MTTPTPSARDAREPVGDLLGQPLLHLRAVGKQLHDPGQFGQTEDAFVGQVPNMGHPDKREQVMLAHRPDRDVPGEDQFVVALGVRESREVEGAGCEQIGKRPRHASGCLGQAFLPKI